MIVVKSGTILGIDERKCEMAAGAPREVFQL